MKLIATDLDGTLLNNSGEVSARNVQAIKKAIEHGIEFVVATGRSFDAANKPLQAVGLTAPVISLNGAMTYSLDGKLLRDVPLDQSIVRKIQLACQEEDIYFEVFTNDGVYSTSRENFIAVMEDILKSANPNLSEEEIRENAELRFQHEKVQFIENYDELFHIEGLKIFKILAFSLEKEKLNKVYVDLEKDSGIAITSSGDINLEFNHPDAQKGIALEVLAKNMGIEMKDVMSLGDNFNDVSMLKMAGRSVSMGNAVDEIKALCSHTTKINEEHGVAFAIEEMLKEVAVE
ncbi:hypothetical protein CIL05_02885 [Virgibacillus profundi]|uniref:Hydrolase n=1 Tax=Virgibacillus profundi TaxID=2024555 RepID=A0A2A2IJQ1_9BACI|nr:Cof-type HAD-IIB family hydrolase [Virgibacillus profundi]PAV31618.1 hypothetical protein CIL05_02885 [Virgibacillus profundi]PXY55804.1 HAD family phosphatase [Virgibacillus profundi]